jgi:gas vesicle protein
MAIVLTLPATRDLWRRAYRHIGCWQSQRSSILLAAALQCSLQYLPGVLAGAVLGAGLGLLFAPKAGSDLREQLSEQAGALASQAQKRYRKITEDAGQWAAKGKDAASELAESGKGLYGKAREAVSRAAEEA